MVRPDRGWVRALATTAVLVLLVALAVGGFALTTVTVLVGTLASAGFFLWLYRGSRFFVLSFANGIVVYACIFTFIRSSNFANVGAWAASLAFLLPLFAFVAGVWWRREAIRTIVSGVHPVTRGQMGRVSSWLVPIAAASALTFLVPSMELSEADTEIGLIAAMALMSLFILYVSNDICVFLIDTGLLFDQLFVRMLGLAAPAFAFLTLYSMTVIVFASVYRIIERVSDVPHFLIGGQSQSLTFNDALYFSLVTISTVGYGEIVPASALVRIVSSVEIIAGVLLLVFGLYEIMDYAREARRREAGRTHGHSGD